MAPYDEGGGDFLPPATQPRSVTGGIRMQSRRGGEQWWSRRWIAALEAAAVGERLAQGVDDARRGRVLELDIDLGVIRASVQGTRRDPHAVTIELGAIEQLAWLRIAQALAGRGDARAELLACEMPDAVEAVFRREGAVLFPTLDDEDAAIGCTCEDWSTPCRHALATALLVTESLDADPLLAFRARGIEPELLMAIVARGAEAAVGDSAEDAEQLEPDTAPVDAERPVDATPIVVSLDPPPIDAPLVRILGAPPMWRGADAFEPAMRRIYARVASDPRTIDLALNSVEPS